LRPGREVKIEVEDDVLEHLGRARYGSFSRSIALPKGVTVDQVEAITKDGVVEISIPKPREEERKAVEITPKAG